MPGGSDVGEILQVQDLHTYFFSKEGTVKAVNGVNFSLRDDSILPLVGESGSGKTVTTLSILRLLPYAGRIVQGRVLFNGNDLLGTNQEKLRALRGKEISIVFQDPRASLNPIVTIGDQVEEVLLAHTSISKREARKWAESLLMEMGLPEPPTLLNRYPFQLSGGMCQRVMLSIALALRPKVLIADEPTSNLDTTLQAAILERLRLLKQEYGTAILLITHDMGIVAQMADEVAVMYAGHVVEQAEPEALFNRPSHPYTWGLFRALPRLDDVQRSLVAMQGTIPDMIDLPEECPFIPRCPKATNTCRQNPMPLLMEIESEHRVACFNAISYDWEEEAP